MNYRELGNTGKKVSVLGFGLMRLPVVDGDTEKIDVVKSLEMVEYAVDKGVNYLDTAYPYHRGESENFTGTLWQHIPRDKIYLASKLPSWNIKESSDLDKYLNEQLEKMKTDRIDFYLLHALNSRNWENLKKQGVLEWLAEKKKSGLIKHAGFSFHDSYNVFEDIITSYDWEFCQIQYNYLDTKFQAGERGLDLAHKRGTGVISMEPLRGGLLAKQPPKEVADVIKNSGYQGSQVSLSLRWVWQQTGIGMLLSGMSDLDQVKENVAIASGKNLELSKEEENLVTLLYQAYNSRIKVPCTACNYCMPCPQGVAIPGIFHFYNSAHIFDDHQWGIKCYPFINKDNQADKCVKCGICETKCPQQIKIMSALETAHNYMTVTP
ncbi:MAG: aldo/keto reductase [Candidatus Stygibacter frigidus]|nr:aldo/keto reductase [Candidatus Stygibacter frigidus]